MDEKIIKNIFVENIGYLYAKDGEIKEITKNGEMSLVDWYKQGDMEFNGKYVIRIEYEK